MNKIELLKELGYSKEFIESFETYDSSRKHEKESYGEKIASGIMMKKPVDSTGQNFTITSNSEVSNIIAFK